MIKIKIFIANLIGGDKVNAIKYLFSFRHYNKFKKYKDTKKIIYALTPLHGNIGDQAIAVATIKFLKENFIDYEVIEVNSNDIYTYGKAINKVLNKDDLIVLHGGGNMGNLYIEEEKSRRFIIKNFPKNKIISMTQTMSFTNDDEGIMELEKTKKIYNSHQDLTIIAREETSYKIMKEELRNNKILLNPDIVLYLHDIYKNNCHKRKNIMTCLRKDKESLIAHKRYELIEMIDKKYKHTFHYDTVVNKLVTKEIRENEVKDMLNKFLSAKVVITDRLHGMVFAVITKTPCIITKSLDHKVPGTYKWIKNLNYIKMIDDLEFEKIENIIDNFLNLEKVNEINFKEIYFEKLKENVI
ncbi:polysaccharide pyruvyl transferase family protein [Clostridium celatum]|uniref:polysaccharide pyruvyl transferase family protein n=1 Tax=Clostridium celatum TaxID=36834 RepID=UPI001F41BA90|nr:polysaccharide pyruvyl transferase family protein [Clostridium celatum]MCE9654382.1 polysaccharide pyruvyl transferase family protein [Clostridium celatum]